AAAALAVLGSWPARVALAASGLWCVLAGRRRGAGLVVLAAAAAGLIFDARGWSAWNPGAGWAAAVSILRANSVVGVGPGLLGRELARAGWAGGAQSFALGVGAETGYFGLLLFAAASVASVPAGFARLDGAARAASAAFVAFAVYGFVADVPASPAFLAALAASAAVGLSAGRLGESRAADHGTPLRLQRWFTGIGLAVAVGAAAPRFLLRRALAEAESAVSVDKRIAALERASRLAPDDGAIHARLAQEDLLANPARVGEALRRIRLAADAEPANPVYRARLAELWAAFGALDRAAAAAREVLALQPEFLSPRLILAELEAVEGRLDSARLILLEARARRSKLGPGAGVAGLWDDDRERRIDELLRQKPGRRAP
ncbi:MAG: hypothetical protein HY925_07410, partial [Elusimicrobia bacterium]|nr:hypothetical protein [Elusimicrobiota bacterium]